MGVYTRGTRYWASWKHQGQRIRKPTGIAIDGTQRALAEAQQEARRLRVEHEQNTGPGGRARGATLAVLEQLDIERALNSGLGERRADTLENLWRNLERHLGEHRDVATLTLGELDDYEGKRRAESHRGRSTTGQTIRRERGAFVRGLRLAKRRGLLERYPFDLDDLGKVRSDPRDARQAGKLWSTEQINDVLEALSDKAKSAGYDRMLRLIQRTGLRLNEFRRCASFVRVKAPRGSGAHELLTIDEQHAKTRRARVVPLIRDDGDTIDELGNTFGTKKFNHALVLASAEAGLPGVLTPRDLRKWYLSTAAGSDVLAAQRLGGHSNVATTGLYLEAEIARAIRAGLGAARAATAEGGHTGGPQRKRTGGKAQ